MRPMLLVSGVLLWFNAFACREELWQAYVVADATIHSAINAGGSWVLLEGPVLAALAVVSASPIWKFCLGCVLLMFSGRE
jgi:hypothetical protein